MPSADLPPAVHVEEPRAFGHFIGDRVTRHIDITVPEPFALAGDRLPQRARLSKWVELDDVAVRASRRSNATRYLIELTYQIVDSPTQPELAAIPSVGLRFVGGGRSFEQAIDAWPLAIAPLAPDETRAGLEAMRPARAPVPIDAAAGRVRLLLFGAAAAVLFVYLALVQVVLPRLKARRGPFAAAHRTLCLLAASAPSVVRHQAALRAVHRAFDRTAGFGVFAPRLEEFWALHPEFLAAREPARIFFESSRQAFFGPGGGAANAPLEGLLALTALCMAIERRGGGVRAVQTPQTERRARAFQGQAGAQPPAHGNTL
jgi:mxaA protein